MSTVPPAAPLPLHVAPRAKKEPNEITIISHSNLYYWWPVWAFGFLMAIITYFEGYVMAVLPEKGVGAAVNAEVTVKTHREDAKEESSKETKPNDPQVVVWAPQGGDSKFIGLPIQENNKEAIPPYLRVSPHKAMGVVYVFILLMVIFITNVPLRGMWSLLVLVVAVSLIVVFSALGWIESMLGWLYLLDVRINMAGYMTISLFLLFIWLLALLIFDKQRYITVTPGQLKVCDEVGGGEQVYSTDGMTMQKQRSDFFRHYVLGLGSGDLIIRTSGAQAHHIDLPNVLFINAKVRQVENLLKTKNVIETN